MDQEKRAEEDSGGGSEALFGVAELAGEFIPEAFWIASLAVLIVFVVLGSLAVLIQGITQDFFEGPPQSLFR